MVERAEKIDRGGGMGKGWIAGFLAICITMFMLGLILNGVNRRNNAVVSPEQMVAMGSLPPIPESGFVWVIQTTHLPVPVADTFDGPPSWSHSEKWHRTLSTVELPTNTRFEQYRVVMVRIVDMGEDGHILFTLDGVHQWGAEEKIQRRYLGQTFSHGW
jgi:hypothetical protein